MTRNQELTFYAVEALAKRLAFHTPGHKLAASRIILFALREKDRDFKHKAYKRLRGAAAPEGEKEK